jgi:predicted Zn finger-like uncharacterized protein
MILTCPHCDTRYFAEDTTIGRSGRTVKCAACEHSWFVGQSGNPGAGLPASGGAHKVYREKILERRARASRSAAILAWAVVACLFAGLVTGGILMRDRVTGLWPQSAAAFSALGLKVNRFGVEFADENAERYLEGTTPVLEISGKVVNLTESANAAPLVRARLLDDAGQEIGAYYAGVTPGIINAGETGSFRKRIENPPFEAFELALDFAPAGTEDIENGRVVADAGTAQ